MKALDSSLARLTKMRKKKDKDAQKSLTEKNVKWRHSDWKSAFVPVQRRIILKHMLHCLSSGILLALAVILILISISFFFPFEHLIYASLISSLSVLVIVLVFGWLKRPSVYEIARMADKFGLQEKVLTACELDERDDVMAQIQRNDAVKSLSAFNIRQISLRVPKSHGVALILLTLAVVTVNFIPNPMDRIIQERKELKAEVQQQLSELEKVKEDLMEQESLTKGQKQQLAELMEQLAEKLRHTTDHKEAIKEISKAEESLATLTDKIREESIGLLSEYLSTLRETNALAEALNERNPGDLENELNKLKEQLRSETNSQELARKLKEVIDEAANSMADGKIKENLSAASASLNNGEITKALQQLGGAMKQAVDAGNAMGDVRYALQQMRSSIARAAGEAQYAQNAGQPGSGKGQSDSKVQGSGQGQGQGQGSGKNESFNQEGGGQNGSGAGNGSTNKSSGQNSSGTTGGQNGSSQIGERNAESVYERVYAPERLGDGGESTHVPGQLTGEGEITSEHDGKGIGDLSGYIPYREVYQEYRNEAMKSMERRALPPSVQELVRKYFDALD